MTTRDADTAEPKKFNLLGLLAGAVVLGLLVWAAVAFSSSQSARQTSLDTTLVPGSIGEGAAKAAERPAPLAPVLDPPVLAQAGVVDLRQNHADERGQRCGAVSICVQVPDGVPAEQVRTYTMFIGQRRDGISVPVPAGLSWQHGNGAPPATGCNALPAGGQMCWWPNPAA